jgi:hypothetical protein
MYAVRQHEVTTRRYAQCVDVSKRICWDIDRDVIRGRHFDLTQKFMPDGLTQVYRLPFLDAGERRFLSQVQGRTYANMFRLCEHFIGAKMLEVGLDHAPGNPVAFEAIERFTDEELKHQELFRRIELLTAEVMPQGYRFVPERDALATFVLSKSTWAILALTCHLEIFSQVHYRHSMEIDNSLSPLFRDVFLFHWKEESQHAIIDEMEWKREDARLDDAARDAAVDDLIALVEGIDDVLQMQAEADTSYFCAHVGRTLLPAEADDVGAAMLDAYRWQYIVSGVREPRFHTLLARMVSEAQGHRIADALAPLMKPKLAAMSLPLV